MKAKKTYNKSKIMRRAWIIFRSNNNVNTFSDALKQSWNIAKNDTSIISFNQIYSEHYNKVLNFISSKIKGRREIAEEITQDVFIKVNEHIKNYDVYKGAITTWIYTIANNKVIDFYRSDKSNYMVGVDGFVNDEGESIYEFKDTSNADESVNSEETMSSVERAMSNLNEKEKSIATLYFIKQMKYEEIAMELNIPMGTVKGLINRIRNKLQTQLKGVYSNV
jgi:RNA polymerase sigma-70 factor (ECF subfamily)